MWFTSSTLQCATPNTVRNHSRAHHSPNASQTYAHALPFSTHRSSAASLQPPGPLRPTSDEQKAAADADPSTSGRDDPQPRSAYVHLPFCKKKCLYCDFPVVAVGVRPDRRDTDDLMSSYVDLICQEISFTAHLNPSGPLQTVFFGGGTPSLLPPAQLERILTALDRAYGIAPGAEVSIEADPGTFDAARLRTYMSLGLTRFSVGVQSFEEELLRTCGRAHDVRDAYRAIEAMHAAGVPSGPSRRRGYKLDL
jgi:coproporphyrinogen III oxidase-like Fe-S oxidoreductase